MEFWGLEVCPGKTARVYSEPGTTINIDKVSLGAVKKENLTEVIKLTSKNIHGEARTVGTIYPGGRIDLSQLLALDETFELSHNWKDGSVSFFGYSEEQPYDPDVDGVFPVLEDDDLEDDDGGISRNKALKALKAESDAASALEAESDAGKPLGYAVARVKSEDGSAAHNSCASSNPSPNKRPRLTDSPRLYYEENAFELVYLVVLIQQGKTRVDKLLSEVDLMSDNRGILKMLDAHFDELLNFVRILSIVPAIHYHMLLEQTQLVLKCLDQIVRSTSDCPEPVPSPMVLSDWKDQAYDELLSLRKDHSKLLDSLYKEKCEEFKEKKTSYGDLLRCKKCLKFMARSRYEISSLSKKKCNKRAKQIEHFVAEGMLMPSRIRHENQNLPDDSASCNQTQVNWRDKIYEEIKSCRMMHSLKLDEAYRSVNDMPNFLALDVAKEVKVCREFLDSSLQFLAYCRADLVSLSQEECSEKLKKIQCFVDREDSEPANHFWFLQTTLGYWTYPTHEETSGQWRDVAYAKLKTKADKFSFLVRDVYNDKIDEWSKEPESDIFLEQLDTLISEAWLGLYQMPRSRMSLYLSADDYFAFVDEFVHGSYHIKFLFKKFQGGVQLKWDPIEMIPKRFKLLP